MHTPSESAKPHIILPESPDAARLMTVTGWMSRDGRFFGPGPENERVARWNGSTYVRCDDCQTPILRGGWALCRNCRDKRDLERWAVAERAVWDGTTPLYSEARQVWFFDRDDLDDYCGYEPNNTTLETIDDLRLYICRPQYAADREIDNSLFDDLLPSDDPEPPAELSRAIEAFNAALKGIKEPLSWAPTKVAAVVAEAGGIS